MKTLNPEKKVWTRPAVKILIISKDTFSGSIASAEGQIPDGSASVPKDPTPR
jgi:hypothetical protein